MLKTRSPEAQAFITRYHISWEQILLPLTYFCCPSQVLPKILREKNRPSGRAAMDTQVGPSGSQGSITMFPEMQPRHSEPGILLPQLLPLLKKQLRESFHEFTSAKSYSLGQYSRCKVSARCEVFCFQREKNQTDFWSQMGCSCSPPLSV